MNSFFVSKLLLFAFVLPISQALHSIYLQQNLKEYKDLSSEFCEEAPNSQGFFSDLTFSGHVYFGLGDQSIAIKTIFDTRSNTNWAFSDSDEPSTYELQCYNDILRYFKKCTDRKNSGNCRMTAQEKDFFYRGTSGKAESYYFESRIAEESGLAITLLVDLVKPPYADFRRFRASASIGLGVSNQFIRTEFFNSNIDQQTFSLTPGTSQGDLYLTIGGYNPDALLDPNQIVYFKATPFGDDTFKDTSDWELPAQSVLFGNYSKQIEFAVLDSVSSFIQLPKEVFEKYVDLLLVSGLQKEEQSGLNKTLLLKCSQVKTIPDIVFVLKDKDGFYFTYTIPKEDFVLVVTGAPYIPSLQRNELCEIFVKETSPLEKPNTIVLGTSFMNKYMTIFNMFNRTVGISRTK